MKPASRAPFPRLFSSSRLDSPCCWCGREDDDVSGTNKPDTTRSLNKTRPSAFPLTGRTSRRRRRSTRRRIKGRRTGREADDAVPPSVFEPTCQTVKPMRDARRRSGTGSEDFLGSVIVRWKVLLSPRCRKKTYHQEQVS